VYLQHSVARIPANMSSQKIFFRGGAEAVCPEKIFHDFWIFCTKAKCKKQVIVTQKCQSRTVSNPLYLPLPLPCLPCFLPQKNTFLCPENLRNLSFLACVVQIS